MTTAIDFDDVDLDDMPDVPSEFVTPNHEASENPPEGLKRIWTPPTKKSKTSAPKLKKPAPRMPSGGLAAPLADMYTMIGAVLSPIDQTCGNAIMASANDCGKALEKLAKTNPEVRRVLVGMVTTSTWGAVITAHLPIIMVIATHHLMPKAPEPEPVPDPDINPDFVRATS